jgi:hypothetical protein
MTKRTCASVKSLESIKDVTADVAQQIREVWQSMGRETLIEKYPRVAEHVRQCHSPPSFIKTRELRRIAVDSLLGTHGVEWAGKCRNTGESVHYCNAGDTYATTVLFLGPRLRVGCLGDLDEHRLIREREL